MRVVLLIVGAILGAMFAQGSRGVFGALLGAFVGIAIAEITAARRRMSDLEREIEVLRKSGTARREPHAEPATAARTGPTSEPRSAAARDYYGYDEPASGPVEQTTTATDFGAVTTSPASAGTRPDDGIEDSLSSPRAAPPQAGARTTGESTPPNVAAASSAPASSGLSGWQPAEPAPSEWKPPPRPAPRVPEELPLFKLVREYFTGGNTVVRVGIVILFIGVAFLLRYVAEHTHVPIELRLSGVAVAGVVLLALGWRLRKKRRDYALALQGGAIGILYLTVFASLRLFHVLPAGPAFLVLALLAAFSAALAILQDSLALALLAIGLGFLAPILASSGQGDHVVLFSYYGVLNLGILGIAWFKAWRPLNVVGFLFTFVIGTAWGVLKYRPELFATTEPFLIAFFVLYVAVAILFSLRQRPILRGYVDGTIVFGVPVVAFGLQSAMVHDWPFYSAYSAVAVSAMYLVLAWLLHRGKRDTQRLLVEAFMALGVAFLTLAVPLALDGRWSAATWSLEGAALVWVGCRQGRLLARASGALLQFASGIIFLFDYNAPYSSVPVLNSACLGGVMIAFASVFAARLLQRIRGDLQDYELPFTPLLFFWGLLWWLFSGITEILRHVPDVYQAPSILVFLAVSALLSSELHRRLEIGAARAPAFAILPAMVMFAVFAVMNVPHPLAQGGWAAWPLAFAAFYFLCRRHEDTDPLWTPRATHVTSVLLLIALLTWELAWQVDHAVKGGGSWPAIAWALVPAVALYTMPKLARRVSWPIAAHEDAYVAVAGTVLAIYLTLWSVVTNVSMPGNSYPLPFVPVLNPLDLAEVFVLLVLARYGLHLQKASYEDFPAVRTTQLAWSLAALVFIWLNAALLRTVHHWAGVPYEVEALFHSTLVQTSLAIFWTLLALATMLFATRRSKRLVWIAGASLLAVVVAKLAFIDLSQVSRLGQIVSFIVVGSLMLVMGYFSPLPPARKEAQ